MCAAGAASIAFCVVATEKMVEYMTWFGEQTCGQSRPIRRQHRRDWLIVAKRIFPRGQPDLYLVQTRRAFTVEPCVPSADISRPQKTRPPALRRGSPQYEAHARESAHARREGAPSVVVEKFVTCYVDIDCTPSPGEPFPPFSDPVIERVECISVYSGMVCHLL